MNRYAIIKFYGILSIIMGCFFVYQNVMSTFLLNQPINILWRIVLWLGSILYLICGFGIIKFKKWAANLFLLLMAYFLFRSIFGMYIFLYRIVKGGATLVHLELLIFIWLLLSIFLPMSAFWVFLKAKTDSSRIK
jgi:hypothetical protein